MSDVKYLSECQSVIIGKNKLIMLNLWYKPKLFSFYYYYYFQPKFKPSVTQLNIKTTEHEKIFASCATVINDFSQLEITSIL